MLIPDKTYVRHGLTINEKFIPDNATRRDGKPMKPGRLLSGGTGKIKGVTIHNTTDLPGVHDDAEQYTRATWPNRNMRDVVVHFYVDDVGAWQNLRLNEVGAHAADGRGPGNDSTIAIEIIMTNNNNKEDQAARENGAKLAAMILVDAGLTISDLYTHNHWMGLPDRIVYGASKNCPLYILPTWTDFKKRVAAHMNNMRQAPAKQEPTKPGGATSAPSLSKVKLVIDEVLVTKKGSKYEIQVGAFGVQKNADALVKVFKGLGLTAIIEKPAPKPAPVTQPLRVGDKISIKPGAIDFNTKKGYADFVYRAVYIVQEIIGDTIVFGPWPQSPTGRVDKKYVERIG